MDFKPDHGLILQARRDRRFRSGGHEKIIAISRQLSALSYQPSDRAFLHTRAIPSEAQRSPRDLQFAMATNVPAWR
jgi:hypothetical protein